MYDKVPTNRNVVEHEKEVEKFWKEQDIFKKSMENRNTGSGVKMFRVYWYNL